MTDGIHIPREVADAEGVPEDLDASVVGPYRFPDPRRRRIAGGIYLGLAALVAWWRPTWPFLLVLVGLGLWHVMAAWPLGLDQEEALLVAAPRVPFPVGHASAALTFTGIRARPTWHVVVYSDEDPPRRRALVTLDAVTGDPIGEPYVEDLPPV
ncbi:MAG: hypothetical protein KatS3mg011_1438 [Acidimicrobiia bacterium]|nr:MAG: hypothetical protein KatS3mg011_1438 [Acidimicrobiia bacterium]